MIHITLPDGNVKEFESGATPMNVALSISEGLARNVISASFNEIVVETSTPLVTDGSLVLYTFNDDEGKNGCSKKDYYRGYKQNSYRKDRNYVDSKNYNHNKYSLHNEQDSLNTKMNWCNNCYNN